MVDIAGLKFVATGVGAFIGDLHRAEAAEKQLAATAKKAEGEVGDAAKKAARDVETAADQKARASQRAQLALKALSTVATGIFVAGITSAVKQAMSFESALDQVGAVANATEKDMASLRQEALQIGADTSFSAGQAAKAMHELAAGGRSVAQIMGGEARAAVGLAEAGNYGLAESAKTIATAMDVWKDTQIDTNDVVNRLAGAANTSRFGVEDMSMAIAQGGGVAAQAGVDFQDFTTVIAATASSFASGSDAGTSFKTFITSLSGTSDIAKEKIKELGLSFYDASGALRPMSEIVQQLHDKLGPLSQEAQTVALKVIFGNDAFRTAAQLMKLTGDEFTKMSDKMGTTNAIDVAAQRMGNAAGGMEQLRGSMETLAITFGSNFIPAVTEATSVLTQLVNWLGKLPAEIQIIAIFGGMIAASIPLLVSFASAAKTAAISLGLMKAAANPLTFAIGAVIAALLGTTLLVHMFGDDGPSQTERIADAMKIISASVNSMTDAKAFDFLGEQMKNTDKDMQTVTNRWVELNRLLETPAGRKELLATFSTEEIEGLHREYKGLGETLDDLEHKQASYMISKFELVGGEKANSLAIRELSKDYAALSPDIRQIVDDESQLDEMIRAVTGSLGDQARELVASQALFGKGLTDALAPPPAPVGPQQNPLLVPPDISGFDAWILALHTTSEEVNGVLVPVEDLNGALDELNQRFTTLNPAVLANNTAIAMNNDELADMLANGDAQVGISGRTKEAIEADTESRLRNNAAVAANGEVIAAMTAEAVNSLGAGQKAWVEFDRSLQESSLTLDQQPAVMGRVVEGLRLVKDGSIDAALNGFAVLKEELQDQPEVWAAVAQVMGPEFVAKIAASVTDPAQKALLLQAATDLFGVTATADTDTPAGKASANLIAVIAENISGEDAKASILAGIETGLSAVANADSKAGAEAAAETLRQNVRDAIDDPATEEAVLNALEPQLQEGIANADAKEQAQAKGKEVVDTTTGEIAKGGPAVTTAMNTALQEGLDGASFDTAKANALGSAMVDGVLVGINSRSGEIGAALAGELGTAMVDGQIEIDGHSPSRRTEREIGVPMVQGIVVGIEKEGPEAIRGFVDMVNNMADAARHAFWGQLEMQPRGSIGNWIPTQRHQGLAQALHAAGFQIEEDGSIGIRRGGALDPSANIGSGMPLVPHAVLPALSASPAAFVPTYGGDISLGRTPAERAAKELADWKQVLEDGLSDGLEMTVEEMERMLADIAQRVRDADFGHELTGAVDAAIEALWAGLSAGGGLANQAVIDLIDHITEKTQDKSDWVPWVTPAGTIQMVPPGSIGPSMAEEAAKGPPEIPSQSIDEWYIALEDGMIDGREMTTAEIEKMFEDMTKAMEQENFPAAIKAMVDDSMERLIAGMNAGLGVANASIMALLNSIAAGAAKAAEVTYEESQQFKPPTDMPNVSHTPAAQAHAASLEERKAAAAAMGVTLEEYDAYIARMRADPAYASPPVPGEMPIHHGLAGHAYIVNPDGTTSPIPEGTYDPSANKYFANGQWHNGRPPTQHAGITPENPTGVGLVYDPIEQARLEEAERERIRLLNQAPPGSVGSHAPSYGNYRIQGFAHGTDHVPSDMLAFLHKGEAVIPSWMNDLLGSWSDLGSGPLARMFAASPLAGLGDIFGGPIRSGGGDWGREGNGGITFKEGSLVVNFSGPPEMARQVGEDFGDAFLRTLRSSGSNALGGRS